jgi:outer membrane protein OmpA-like peptidoglycan-associated protein
MVMQPEATRTLRTLAGQLANSSQKLRVEVVGYAKDVPLFQTRDSLATRRAKYVADILRDEAGLPSERISVRPASQREVAAALDSSDERLGETVVIHFYP